MARAASSNASWRRLNARISYLAPYASRAWTIAPGPQPPFRLSRRLSHSRERFTSSCWNFSVLSARPSAVSVIWTPAGAHQSFVSCVMKADFGFFTTRTVTGFFSGVGVGVGVGWTVGNGAYGPGSQGRPARRRRRVGSGRGLRDRTGCREDRGRGRPIGRRVDDQVDPVEQAREPVPGAERVRVDRPEGHDRSGQEHRDKDQRDPAPAPARRRERCCRVRWWRVGRAGSWAWITWVLVRGRTQVRRSTEPGCAAEGADHDRSAPGRPPTTSTTPGRRRMWATLGRWRVCARPASRSSGSATSDRRSPTPCCCRVSPRRSC